MLFMGTFFVCQFVLMMQFLWQRINDLIGKGLSVDVLAQFFWHMGLYLVPQALPLAILLSALITFGNLSERSELTAMKAAGISLMQVFRPLVVVCAFIAIGSFYFQNSVGPKSTMKMAQLLVSMRQKSPELEIPEGIFYDGIPNCNLYVEKKDLDTGVLYGIMIYRMTGSYEDQAIILADSGMLQSTAEKKHLLLTLWSGEWFENMRSQELGGSASVPYRRETFIHKRILLPYDGDFNMANAGGLGNKARGKSLRQLAHGRDSLIHAYDSVGRGIYEEMQRNFYSIPNLSSADSTKAIARGKEMTFSLDTLMKDFTPDRRLSTVNQTLSRVKTQEAELEFRSMVTNDGDKQIREHRIEAIQKFTLALTCIIFFFIGAPLGAIIRKGGLGIPVIISVIVFIVYYILNMTLGYRMAQKGLWTIGFALSLAPAVLIPAAFFVTYKANNDSAVFNIETYREAMRRLLGLRLKRNVMSKEVVIYEPDYERDGATLQRLNADIAAYASSHRLLTAPNVVKVFFRYEPDHEVERISSELETVIEDLENSRDAVIISALNDYPRLSVKAHTRPFEHRWMNIVAALVLPVGLFLYCRMWMFRLRLAADLRAIRQTSDVIVQRIGTLTQPHDDAAE
jgi:lipopolysaccharide export system permease protein